LFGSFKYSILIDADKAASMLQYLGALLLLLLLAAFLSSFIIHNGGLASISILFLIHL
jgi:hypothetical protein